MWPLALAGILGLGIATWLGYKEWAKIATFAPPAALLVFACAAQDIYRTPFTNRLLELGGKISYGVYLIHPLIIPILGTLIFAHIDRGWLGTGLLFATALPATVGLAYLSYRYFETPSNKWLRDVLHLSWQSAPSRKTCAESVV